MRKKAAGLAPGSDRWIMIDGWCNFVNTFEARFRELRVKTVVVVCGGGCRGGEFDGKESWV